MIITSGLFELKKAEQMIAAGKISGKGIKDLKSKGMIRSERQYMKGIDKGTAFKLKGTGSKFKKSEFADTVGPRAIQPGGNPHTTAMMIPGMTPEKAMTMKPTIIWPKSGRISKFSDPLALKGRSDIISKKQLDREGALLRRHEADELTVRNKDKVTRFYNEKKGKVVGKHTTPEILRREKDLANYTTKAYGVGKGLEGIRKDSGEYDYAQGLNKRKVRKEEKRLANVPFGSPTVNV